MNIIQLLKDDHKKMKEVMEKLEEASLKNNKSVESLFSEFKKLYAEHDDAENKIFYPALHDAKELNGLTEKGNQAHHVVDIGILELKLVPFASYSWAPKFSVVQDSILLHMQEEEDVLFPKAESFLSNDQLQELAEKVQAQRE